MFLQKMQNLSYFNWTSWLNSRIIKNNDLNKLRGYMEKYPSISYNINRSSDFYCFDKIDGSNIRVEWSRKKEFCKFGTRSRLLDETDLQFSDVPSLAVRDFEQEVSDIAKKERVERMTLFFEYFGPNSFAGNHQDDDTKTLTLLDVSIHKRGIISPKEFINLFGNLNIAQCLYRGKVGESLIRAVRNRTLDGMTFEGIVCKANNPKRPGYPIMFKVKSDDWYKKLKEFCQEDAVLFEQLK